MSWKCSHCDRNLFSKEASIPVSIICYETGTVDPQDSRNRIVTEWHCPVHGCKMSPGGGICSRVSLIGGPWDGRSLIWAPYPPVQEIIVSLPDGTEEVHRYAHRMGTYEPMVFDWEGKVEQ